MFGEFGEGGWWQLGWPGAESLGPLRWAEEACSSDPAWDSDDLGLKEHGEVQWPGYNGHLSQTAGETFEASSKYWSVHPDFGHRGGLPSPSFCPQGGPPEKG